MIRDEGERFYPEEVPEPDYDVPLEKLKPRGAGLYLIREMMDEVDFKFDQDEGNTLTMKKRK